MNIRIRVYVLLLLKAVGVVCVIGYSESITFAAQLAITSVAGVSVLLEPRTGNYSVSDRKTDWVFAGTLGTAASDIHVSSGSDRIGSYTEITFDWQQNALLQGTMRDYTYSREALFTISAAQGDPESFPDFPNFTTIPRSLHSLSFVDDQFSPPEFGAVNSSTPWFLFDGSANTFAISPASNFLIAQLDGDGETSIGSGLIKKIVPLPPGFSHQTVIVFGQGIGKTIQSWGDALTTLGGKAKTTDDADRMIKYIGYWTDNGAYYYYNYDKSLGYAETIQAIRQHYLSANIPLGYLQLDSWWYQKSTVSYDGTPALGRPNLPMQSWNYFGGTVDYTASPDLFPGGLASFQQKLGLPLVVHGRWLDPNGPYASRYKMSGVVSIDPKWWDDRMAYLKQNGVFCYEQDWLSDIYFYTPEMATTLNVAADFTDNMARAAAANGITLQYCMPMPRFLMQGSLYPNLTTARASGDRFWDGRYNNFLYTSMLDNALRIRPWTDVFDSTELGNLTVSTLSSGPVGIGDQMGSESRSNILLAARTDGVIVKPDAPLLPTDLTILSDCRLENRPLIASTYTDQGQRTVYVFAYARKGDSTNVNFTPSSFGFVQPVYVYNTSKGSGALEDVDSTYGDTLAPTSWALYIIAPVGKAGIAFLGDPGKIVSTGRQRIASITDRSGTMTMTLVVSPDDPPIELHGYAAALPTITVQGGSATAAAPGQSAGEFTTTVTAGPDAKSTTIDGDPVKLVTVTMVVAGAGV